MLGQKFFLGMRAKLPLIVVAIGLLSGIAAVATIATNRSRAESKGEELELDSPDLAHAWRRLAWLDEKGRIAPDALATATEEMEAMQKRPQRIPRTFATDKWVERGPYNVAGRSRVLLIHPTNPKKMWMGTAGGGIWMSTDGGTTWAPVSDNLPCLAISSIAFDPKDPMTMYAGTGEGYFNSDMITGRGVLKSQDGGVTWASLPNSQSMTNVNRLVVSPTESNVILAACTYGGIFRSTNSGTNWTKVFNAQAGQTVVFHPTDGSKAVASVLDYDFTRSTWFHRPIYTTDGGINWTAAAWNDNEGRSLDGFSPRLELAYSKSQPNNVFAYCGYYGKVYKSTNGGQTFNSVTTTTTTNGQAWYDTSIWVDPVNENWMVVTGVHPFRSIDGGATFTQISRGYIMTDDPHPDVHFGVADPGYNGTTNNRFYLTTDGGAFVTNSVWTAGIGSGWSMLTRTARSSQFYGAIGDEATGRIIGGMQDNGTIQQDFDSRDASLFFGGDGGWCALDPTNSNYMYGEYVYLKLFRSTDGGNTVQYIRNGLTDSDDSRNRANFIAPFVLDDSNPNRMYAGGASLWRTTNLKGTSPSWTAIKPEFPTSGYSPISAVAVSPSDPNVVWVGHNNGAVFRTGNALATTPTWTVVDDNGTTNPLPNRYVGRILIDSTNPAKVWVAHGGFANDNLRVTTDGGATWALATGSGTSVLPSAPIRALAQHPTNPNRLFAGTEVGVMASSDGGATWSAMVGGPGTASIDELRFMYHSTKLIAATHGRGLWTFGTTGVRGITIPSSIDSAGTATGTVTLDTPATAAGEVVSLATSDASVSVPTTVTVPSGAWRVTFPISSTAIATAKVVTVSASLGGITKSAKITVQPPKITDFTLSATSIAGSATTRFNATVTIDTPVATSSVFGTVTTRSTALVPPATFRVLAKATKTTFAVATQAVPTTGTHTLTVTLGKISKSATIEVRTARIKSLALTPRSVKGGSATVVTGTITLDVPAASGGAVVTLTSADASVAAVPSSITVAAGQTVGTFTITHNAVTANKGVTISASREGLSQAKVLTVTK